jgi:8-oxo-dGTP pyrophosphatase MutT (NUDIX family)
VPVKPPAVPLAAATLVLLRDRPPAAPADGAGPELLLIKRHRASRFAAGDHVFPGGKVEACDAGADAAVVAAGVALLGAAGVPGGDRALALAHRVGVLRETFEEVGLLLARDASGRPARLDAARRARWRAACQAEDAAFFAMLREEGLTLAVDGLVYVAHWITPEESPLRFDTLFFAALAPAGQDAVDDGREIVDVRWLAPGRALEAAARGEISLRNPTARTIELFVPATSAARALEGVRGREVTTIRPRVITENGARRVLMPGDPGYW